VTSSGGAAPLGLTVLGATFAIHRFAPDAALPDAVRTAVPVWIARTPEELSIVCAEAVGLAAPRRIGGWRCLQVAGPLPLDLVGVLAGLSTVLAEAGVCVLALSTHDTDFLLVPGKDLERGVAALRGAGYGIAAPT